MLGSQVSERISFKNILYPTDFSRYSDAALPFASSLARKYGSKVFAVHVVSLSPFPDTLPTQAWRALAAQGIRDAREGLRKIDPQWVGIPHESLIRKGDVWKELAKILEAKEVDLIVCGTHGRTGISKVLIGSIAEKICRHATCPVLTVGPCVARESESLGDIHSILFPTDFSAESVAAARYAVSLAQENRARLYLLHVVETPVSRAIEEYLSGQLRDLVPSEVHLSCAPKTVIDFGDPVQKITDSADELSVDLIVLGAKRTAAIPGSDHLPATAMQRTMCRATCPVLTISGS